MASGYPIEQERSKMAGYRARQPVRLEYSIKLPDNLTDAEVTKPGYYLSLKELCPAMEDKHVKTSLKDYSANSIEDGL